MISIGAELFDDFDSTLMQAECEITVGSDTGSVSTTLKVWNFSRQHNVGPIQDDYEHDEINLSSSDINNS